MAIVQTRALTKVFRPGQAGAVVGVDLESREGEFLVLLGPSGSGKTTLLRMIAGLEEPTSGEILIGGALMNDRTPRERGIAMVFQSYALYPHLTVFGNIVFPLKAQGVPRAQRQKKAEWAAALLGIAALLDRKPRELSGGERQRVALARAIVREPSVFLLDEPLSNLDAKLRASARQELEQFQRRVRTTMIYVTHDQVEAMAMGDRVVVMNKGIVHQVGTPTEVYDNPADSFVATFLGSPPMNLVEVGEAVVGFRPEHLVPAEFPGTGARVPFSFRLESQEYLGSERILYGRLEGGRFSGTRVVSRLPASYAAVAADGAPRAFGVDEVHLKFFENGSGLRRAPVPLV